MKSESTTYHGIVTSLDRHYATVALNDAPKCEGCAISAACGSRPSERTVRARTSKGIRVGQEVTVSCPPSAQSHATLWGIAFPCVVLIAVTLLSGLFTANQTIQAAVALISVAAYYLIIYLLRKRISRNLDWTIVS